MITILVTGGGGQLAQSIKSLDNLPDYKFIYTDVSELDITEQDGLFKFFEDYEIDWCINCAAYTAVDKAESDFDAAHKVNIIGAKNLALVCKVHNTKLIHISTDFVFSGEQNIAYTEEDAPSPINIYGETKLQGEIEILSVLNRHFIIRTSWLYSEFGHNFLNTMLRLSKEREELQIVDNQIGTPTYAGDLAQFVMDLIVAKSDKFGLYNYSNEGVASWYDFAKAIFEISNIKINVVPIPSTNFPTPAKRPTFSVLNKSKIKQTFNHIPPYWRDSLNKVLISL